MADSNEIKNETVVAETTPTDKAPAKGPGIPRGIIIAGVGVVAILLVAGASIYFLLNTGRVYTDAAQIEAPLINLSPTTSGTLQTIYVQVGDTVPANTPVAQVGNEIVKTQIAGTIVSTNTNIGQLTPAGTTVVTMIDPTALRVVGQVDENKGLSKINVGDRVEFTVDAFGSKTYEGVIDEVSPTAHAGDVVFNISDERQTQSFDVKVRFDITAYPELKNGMSARMYIYTNQ